MIGFTAKTDQGTIKASIPSSWEEVDVALWLKLDKLKAGDPVNVFSLLTGFDFEALEQSKDERIEGKIYEATAWVYDAPEWDKLPPLAELVIEGKPYQVPQDLDQCTLGQKVLINQAIARSEDTLNLLVEIVAIYMQPVYYGGKFDREKLPDMRSKLLALPCIDVVAVGYFFLTNGNVLQRIGAIGLREHKTPSKTQSVN